jgi:membrane fusion protein, multidrug efflux system
MARNLPLRRLLLSITAASLAGTLIYGIVRLVGWMGSYESTDDATLFEEDVSVSSDVMGRIVSIKGAEGDRVTEGEELVRLDESGIDAQVSQAEVAVDFADRGAVLARVKLDEASGDFERAEAQFQRKIIPQEQYEHQKQALAAAQASCGIASAQRDLATAQLRTLRANIPHTFIVSPSSGIIAKKWVSAGEVVQPAQPIFTLYDLEKLKVRALFKETQIRRIQVGDTAKISIDAYPGITLAGTIETIGIATASQFALMPSDNSSGNYTKIVQRVPVTIALSKPMPTVDSQGRLGPGLSVEVRIAVERE